jgi:pimeloyl-ACP methyl ester carboxylesterase
LPILTKGPLNIDYADEGDGENVVLLHSSASGNRQWQALASAFKGRRRVIAPNLFGYGATSPWAGSPPQKVSDQAALVCAALEHVEGRIDFVGHSFGALVALEAAAVLGDRARRLVLFEPNPFAFLDRPGYLEAYAEVLRLYRYVKEHGLRGDWFAVAERFVDYFSGDGSWAAMPIERRSALAASLAPNLHEWDAVMDPELRLPSWKTVTAPTLLVWASDTRASLRAVAEILLEEYTHWERCEIERGGHMAPLTRPRAFNVHVERFLGNS